MKVFISADIEGCAGVTRWDDTRYGGQRYEEAAAQMTSEVDAACRAAIELGHSVVVKDAHEDAVNIDHRGLPEEVVLVRGWPNAPADMMYGMDESFGAAIYIGYHAGAGMSGNPLTHTGEYEWFYDTKINGRRGSEFYFNKIWADAKGVPSVLLTGDRQICRHARELCPTMDVVVTKDGLGDATVNLHPDRVVELIYQKTKESLSRQWEKPVLENEYTMELSFKDHQKAARAAWYPGTKLLDDYTVSYTAKDPVELSIAKMFMTQ